MLSLYHHGSSACAAKVRLALAEKGLDWDSHYVDLMRGEQFAPDYVALNPKAVVPTLVHDGAVITESTVICEYVDESFPDNPPILPPDPLSRAQVRIWTKAVDEELHPACSALTYIASHRYTILRNGAGDFEAFLNAGGTEGRAARERKWHWIQQGFEAPGAADQVRVYASFISRMEQALATREWLVGGSLTMADIAMAPYLYRLDVLSMGDFYAAYPRVVAWYSSIRRRASFARAIAAWMPDELAREMNENGARAWVEVADILGHEASPDAGELQ